MFEGQTSLQEPFHPVDHEMFEKPSPLTKSQRRQANKARSRAQKAEQEKARELKPLNESQEIYMDVLADPEVTQIFAVGEAGTGKTYIGSRTAARRLLDHQIKKIIISRPTISTPGHALGFLPGGLKQKLAPWLVPIMDALKVEMTQNVLGKAMEAGEIEFVSFEHMRGRTFHDAFVILDEAQNCTLHDLKLFLTRKGENSTYVVSGDPTQVDINNSGLEPILKMIDDYELSPEIVEFDANDVVRSADAKEWVKAFARRKKELERATD
jgi:phosphate starvation-inducible PhoH-like protein